MKRLKTLLILLAAHFTATASTDSTLFLRPINYSEVFEVAKKENKTVMLYFHFDQCGACRKMEKTAFIDNEVAEFYNKNFVSFEINTRKGEGIETNKK
jgi:thioredoxin-related protein